MANTTADANADGTCNEKGGTWGPYWISPLVGAIVFISLGSEVNVNDTDDGGATWTDNAVTSTHATMAMAAWFDRETPGDTGDKIHFAWLSDHTNDPYYCNFDLGTSTVGTVQLVSASGNVSSTATNSRAAITKLQNGTIIAAYLSSSVSYNVCYTSTDEFDVDITLVGDVYETSAEDWCLLYPANVDTGDAAAIYWDGSANQLSVKMYDATDTTWGDETTFGPTMAEGSVTIRSYDAAVRHSDGHIILAAHSSYDQTGNDLLTWDITPDSLTTPTITAKATIFENQTESGLAAVLINQQNDDVYVFYGKGGTFNSSIDIVYHLSDDGLTTWETESAYSEGTTDYKAIGSGRTISADGGRLQTSIFDDNAANIEVNLVNDIAFTASAGGRDIGATLRGVGRGVLIGAR